MSYSVVVEPQAETTLAALPDRVRLAIMRQVHQMAESPSTHAHPTRVPKALGMVFPVRCRFDDMDAFANVHFQYGQDEQTLHIIRAVVEFL